MSQPQNDLLHLQREPISQNGRLSGGLNKMEESIKITSKKKSIKSTKRSIDGKIRLVKLRQSESNSKLGFSLRGGKLPVFLIE